MIPTAEQIEAARTPAGGWTRETLAAWGVSWPQIKTATVCPRYASMADDPSVREEIDAYLADPYRHGEPVAAYEARTGVLPWWWREHLKRQATPSEAPKAGQAA